MTLLERELIVKNAEIAEAAAPLVVAGVIGEDQVEFEAEVTIETRFLLECND